MGANDLTANTKTRCNSNFINCNNHFYECCPNPEVQFAGDEVRMGKGNTTKKVHDEITNCDLLKQMTYFLFCVRDCACVRACVPSSYIYCYTIAMAYHIASHRIISFEIGWMFWSLHNNYYAAAHGWDSLQSKVRSIYMHLISLSLSLCASPKLSKIEKCKYHEFFFVC